jgi:predicted P-loop ATPase
MTPDAIKHDCLVEIATAHSRLSKKWKNKRWKWSDLVSRCAETKRTGETVAEYLRMSREEQSNIKDVGGFVGGYLSGGVRKTSNVMYRTVATLDIDYGTPDVWDDFTVAYNFAAMLYSTHKHTKDKPRYRLVFPLSRQVTPSEYEPLCRRIAAEIGIDLFDITTYQLPRLFYWPSTSKDGDYVFEVQDGPICNVDAILASYINYNDVSEWPIASREGDAVAHEIRKAGDPLEKPGLIGAFCRAYSIEDAIEHFLSDVYEKTAHEGRYTYRSGSVAGGLVCYDGKFAYSHHETDPASMQLCNAFDLCRIHLYGVHDEGTRVTDITRLPSYIKMQDFAAKDKAVRVLLTKERRAEADADFADIELDDADTADDEANTEWMADLEYDRKGAIKSTAKNIMAILDNDNKLAGHLWHDLFSGFDLVTGGLPWDATAKQWGNRDDANLRIYLEENYGVTGKDKIKDAKDAILTKHRKHPIRDYLKNLRWDGVRRLDTLIIDYIGAKDTPLNRAITRKHFAAAVARVMRPGCKYDYCLIIRGAEGIGKSTLFSVMGGEWFNDSLTTTEGKGGMEQLRCSWIVELAELSSIKRSDVEQVKNYLSRRDDIYRAAYGTVVEKHPRQCVFCGTTNEDYFLKGDTGNRRFWVIQADASLRTRSCFDDLPQWRDQIWAEAVQAWRDDEPLHLPAELETEVRQVQASCNDDSDDPMKGMVELFLQTKLPVDWDSWDLRRRRAYYNQPDPLEEIGTVEREYVCAAEFICERLQRDMQDKDYKYLARRICKILDTLKWERIGSKRYATLYGVQKTFKRPVTNLVTDDI